MDANPCSKFLGVWRLIPSSCKYDEGSPPQQATYTLTQGQKGPNHISITIRWRDATGNDMSFGYNITTDGTPQPESYAGVNMTVESSVEGNSLKSFSRSVETGKVVTESFRELKDENQKLEVIMINHKGDKKVRIYQLYQKVH